MQNKIKNIIKEFQRRQYFDNDGIRLVINYENLLWEYPELKLKTITPEKLEVLDNIDIKSFNLTVKKEIGCDTHDYADNWKSIDFVFYGHFTDEEDEEDSSEKLKDPENTCWFEFFSLGDRGEFRLRKELSRPDYDSDDRYATIKGNLVSFENIGEHLDRLIEFDSLLDKQHSEKKFMIEKFRKEQ